MHLLKKRYFSKFQLIFYFLLLIFFGSCTNNKIQKNTKNSTLFFKEGNRVCFVGNSITHMGGFHHNIFLYHVTRFPSNQVSFFNCGIAGDSSLGVLNRMEDDILINNPTHAIIMLGMNDVQRDLYGALPSINKDTLDQRKEAIKIYKKNFKKIVDLFKARDIKVILQKPSIYDQTAVLPEPIHLGVNEALGECAVFIDSLAVKYELPVVDYFSFMNNLNSKIQKSDPSRTLTGNDRIHPRVTGHFVMAYKFLKTEEAPKYVSKIIIDKDIATSSKKSFNCEIKSVSKQKKGITFSVKEYALPFPTNTDQEEGLKIVPFLNELNVQLLKIIHLTKGQFELLIDDSVIGTFTEKQLSDGLNLSEFQTTPQYQQSIRVHSLLNKLWEIEWKLRDLKLIEYMEDYKTCPDKNNLQLVETYLDSVFTKKYAGLSYGSYYKDQLKKYITNKPKEKEYQEASEKLRRKIYLTAQPKVHTFILRSKK